MSTPLLELDEVTIKYETRTGQVTAVSDATLSVASGEYYGLVGESGSGKSTIAKAIIGGLDDNGTITSGAIRYDGREIQDYSTRQLNEEIRWNEISYIPQSSMNSLDPLQRISEQALEIAKTHTDLPKEEALDQFRELFEIVGLQPERIDHYPHQFSGGMQQRAIIALALFLRPSLVIADEPTTALDVIMQDQIFKYLDAINDELGTSMVMITHDISLVFETCSEMAIMHGGQIAESGSVRSLYNNPRHPYGMLLQQAFPDIRYPDRQLEIIEGSPPKTLGEVNHCTFADRCPWAEAECRDRAPPLEPATDSSDDDHLVACLREDDIHSDDLETDQSGVLTTDEH